MLREGGVTTIACTFSWRFLFLPTSIAPHPSPHPGRPTGTQADVPATPGANYPLVSACNIWETPTGVSGILSAISARISELCGKEDSFFETATAFLRLLLETDTAFLSSSEQHLILFHGTSSGSLDTLSKKIILCKIWQPESCLHQTPMTRADSFQSVSLSLSLFSPSFAQKTCRGSPCAP